jgi:hypothetical protein
MENDLLFCSKLMFTNGKIIVYKFVIQFYLYLYLKTSWDKTAIFLSVWRQKKTQKKQPKNKVKHIYFRHYRIRIDHKV